MPAPSKYPFAAVVGQADMKEALILNAICPAIGGVLVRGHKGTAKSTVVRALAEVLPEIAVVAGCPLSCAPGAAAGLCRVCEDGSAVAAVERRRVRVVGLPPGATEDRVVGTIDLEEALKSGRRRFEAGLLAQAHRGILYIDEVNLLDDHLVDVLLDSAALGTNLVERDGVSVSHPARFVLVGTMNQEEGELRPQLLDRFGLCVEVETIKDVEARVQIVRRRLAFGRDPAAFTAAWQAEQCDLAQAIEAACARFEAVELADAQLEQIARLCVELDVQGHRADLVIAQAATALTAWHGRMQVEAEDVRRAAQLALGHRLRRNPFERSQLESEQLDEAFERSQPPPAASADGTPAQKVFAASENPGVSLGDDERDRQKRRTPGRGQASLAADPRGREVGARLPEGPFAAADVAIAPTLRAAALHPAAPGTGRAIEVRPGDIRVKIRERKVGMLVLFVVDASASMGAAARMEAVKGAVLALLGEAYRRRDRVGLVAFGGEEATLLLPPTNSVEAAYRQLNELPTGGRTPLAQGLTRAFELAQQERRTQPDCLVLAVLLSDGRANVPVAGLDPFEAAVAAALRFVSAGLRLLVLDTEAGFLELGMARALAERSGTEYRKLSELAAATIAAAVRESDP